MPLPLTSVYAGLITLIFLTLTWRVIMYRRANTISLGDAGDKNLLKRMRAQANCAEYAPLGLILMALTELAGAPGLVLHVMGIALLGGRLLHALGFAATPQRIILRQLGTGLTLLMLGASALALIGHGLLS
jgi:uncharacterized membrane protein YecN with MAPEG domain